jgi:hypothetical protein
MAKRTPRTVHLAEIRQTFQLASTMGSPPIGRRANRTIPGGWIGWYIRVLVKVENSRGNVTTKYDYFYTSNHGTITTAPWGHAKDYKPGVIPVAELEAAIGGAS